LRPCRNVRQVEKLRFPIIKLDTNGYLLLGAVLWHGLQRELLARWWDRDERGLLATAVLLRVHEGGRICRHARRHCLPDAMSRFAASLIPLPLFKLPLLLRLRVCVCVYTTHKRL